VLVNNEKEEQFNTAFKRETVDLAKYGTILCGGYGKKPPHKMKAKIRAYSGCSFD